MNKIIIQKIKKIKEVEEINFDNCNKKYTIILYDNEENKNIINLNELQENIKKIIGVYPTPCEHNILDWYFYQIEIKENKEGF